MTKAKRDKHEIWLEQWKLARGPRPWPEAKLRKKDPQEADVAFDRPLEVFTLEEAEHLAAGRLLPPLYGDDPIPAFLNELNMAYSEWVATARLDSRKIQAKPESERRSQDRGGNARYRFVWVMLADIYEWHFGERATAAVSNRSNYGKIGGGFVPFVQAVMATRGHTIGADAIRDLHREKTRRVTNAPKRKAALAKRRKRPQKGI